MDDLFDFILEFFLELFRWEDLNRHLRKKIPNKFLRWTVTTLICLLVFVAVIAVFAVIYALL